MRLLAITPPRAIASELDPTLVEAWCEAGAKLLGLAVLLREPGAGTQQILDQRRLWVLREQLEDRGIPALLSVDPRMIEPEAWIELVEPTRPAIAGLQLRGDPSVETCARWRAVLGSAFVVGRSVHGTSRPSDDASLSYSCLAPIFPPKTRLEGESKPAIGLESLRHWALSCPKLFALGGLSPDNAQACLAAGAHGIAGIRLFFGRSAEAGHNVRALRQVFSAAGQIDHVPQAPRR